MNFTETDILQKLDVAFEGKPADDFPEGNKEDIKYNFFLDLQHGYCVTAGSKIHLYADSTSWAIVAEKCGYQNRGYRAEIELYYFGNCINYPVTTYPERSYISNVSYIDLISMEEYERIKNNEDDDMENFELISPTATTLNIHGQKVEIEHDTKKYSALGIELQAYHNPKNLIGFGDIVRFLSDTRPDLVSATENEIKLHIPQDIPKLMTIDKFHFVSAYEESMPSSQETFQLIAKVLVTQNTTFWKPTLKPNNHWTNWNSGFL